MASGILSSILRMTTKLSAPIRRSLGGSSSSDPRGIEEDLDKLKSTLTTIDSVLYDAEQKEISEETVKLWLRELKGVAYDAEDVLDEVEYELLRSKLEAGGEALPTKSTHKRKQDELVSDVSMESPLKEASFRDSIASRIRVIRERFDEIAKERDALQLREEDGPRREKESVRPPTTSHVDRSEVYGREEDSRRVIELLMSDDGQRNNLSVIPIVGMAGIGKTTLAQLVYNDSGVCKHFETRGWVCVSDSFDVARLAKAIIESVTKVPCSVTELGALQETVREVLRGKRFLLVFDDVWNEEQTLWDSLRSSLDSDVEGSKIVVTTRNESVARIVQTVTSYHLNCLSNDDCWLLFRRRAFDGRDPNAHPNLVEIGRMIVTKCRGLPLAAKALGGLLHYEADEENWMDILQSDLWDVDEAGDEILPALKLSYQHLPVHLKHCFVYCSLFPKDFMFKRDELVRLWMVQGLVQSKDREEPEDICSEYFDDLLWRSFFQYSYHDFGEEEMFVMHDLLHDLARSISGQECSVTEDSDLSSIAKDARHSSLILYSSKVALQFKSASEPQALRSLLLIYRSIYSMGGAAMLDFNLVQVKIPNDVFLNFGCLRTLDLSYTDIEELPDSIGGLKHLRYLSVKNTRVRKLPESICRLYYLQTLDLDKCGSLHELPGGIGNLVNLRHLYLPTMEYSLVCMPPGIGRLTGLQELAAFNVGGDGQHCGISELKDMTYLRGDLHVSGLRNVARGWDAKEANLKNMKNIQRLTLDWYVHQSDYKCSHRVNTKIDDSWITSKLTMPWEHFEDEGLVLDGLQPHRNLIVLHIRHYQGVCFPSWVGDPSFSKLVTVKLFQCEKCEVLPPLGQLPSLKNLYVVGLSSVRRIGPEFCGTIGFPFAALEKLEFEWLPEWEEWLGVEEGSYAFPRLAELKIQRCSRLRSVPIRLAPSLTKLEVMECNRLTILPAPPSLTSLNIGGPCEDQIWAHTSNLTALQSLEVVCCEALTCLPLHNLPALRMLVIDECPQLMSLDCRGGPGGAAAVASSSSSAPTVEGLHNLTSLLQLKIENCPLLRLAEDERLPPTLQEVEISCCPLLMEWCDWPEVSSQLACIPQVIVEDYDAEEFQKLVMDTESEEEDKDGMEED